MSPYYPMFVNLSDKACLVIGAGSVAVGKIKSLLAHGARVTILSREFLPEILEMADRHGCITLQRDYREGDLLGYFLVIGATSEGETNQRIFEEAEKLDKLVNIVDETNRCNFILPAVASSGPVQVAVSTSGTSPTLARWLKDRIQASFLDDTMGQFARFLGNWRNRINPKLKSFPAKVQFWNGIFNSPILQWALSGQWGKAESAMKEKANALSSSSNRRVGSSLQPSVPTSVKEGAIL